MLQKGQNTVQVFLLQKGGTLQKGGFEKTIYNSRLRNRETKSLSDILKGIIQLVKNQKLRFHDFSFDFYSTFHKKMMKKN